MAKGTFKIDMKDGMEERNPDNEEERRQACGEDRSYLWFLGHEDQGVVILFFGARSALGHTIWSSPHFLHSSNEWFTRNSSQWDFW
jgi:hypothetical protein